MLVQNSVFAKGNARHADFFEVGSNPAAALEVFQEGRQGDHFILPGQFSANVDYF